MVTTHNLGFPRIGANRELKFALEKYWKGETGEAELSQLSKQLRQTHWANQEGINYLPVGDFSLYDQVLDMSFTLGNLPTRVRGNKDSELDNYFRVARGRSANDSCCASTHAGEMTKWFDTNYHYIVPEFTDDTNFTLNPTRIIAQLNEAKLQKIKAKPVIIGPVTYLWLGKEKDSSDKLKLLDRLLPVYSELLDVLAEQGVEWVQIDEPILVTELASPWQAAIKKSYETLSAQLPKILLATYFGELKENLPLVAKLPVQGLHIDAINAQEEVPALLEQLPAHTVVSLGVINGRNIWKTDLTKTLDWLEPLHQQLQDRLWLAPSCSLLHVPVDLNSETVSQHAGLDAEIKNWLAFAQQKIAEIQLLAEGLNKGRQAIEAQLVDNFAAIDSRQKSTRVHNAAVKNAVNGISAAHGERKNNYATRARLQHKIFDLPLFPTTTIGSFPQTQDIRQTRLKYRKKEIDDAQYVKEMRAEIANAVKVQEELGLDVLVHGEAERNDMVEYFGEQLEGYTFSQFGWVQSYGSRCVKPPIIYGDISRPRSMTVEWTRYAQSLTKKFMKGMLTGPVTMLNWSFVRDDQARSTTCYQLALAIREEVIELEKAGLKIIQIDEAALREGLPLRAQQWNDYLAWAIEAFRVCANGVKDETQIHTHMCYSEFNDIIEAIADMDADVITIETSRSDMELLDAFTDFDYPNDIGPGVYDIHSPNIPNEEHIVALMQKAVQRIPAQRLWINPDCGLKTRQWDEVMPALKNMVNAAKKLRQAFA